MHTIYNFVLRPVVYQIIYKLSTVVLVLLLFVLFEMRCLWFVLSQVAYKIHARQL